jgi:DNA-binding winged helix-turn-helix (wHTH) protein
MQLKAGMIFRFENCTLDPARRSLTCAGEPVQLNPRTFDLLVYLVANADRVVTKDELLSALWPDSFVEESNLSQHVFLLRKALAGEKLGERILTTFPGRGYQIAARVETVEIDAPISVPAAGPDLYLQAVKTTTTLVVTEESETGSAAAAVRKMLPGSVRGRRWLWVATASLLILAIAGAVFAWLGRPRPILRKVVLARFNNLTGEAVLDDSLQSGLRIDLEQSPYIDLMGHSRIADILESMSKPPDTQVAGDVAREICERGNYQVLLSGEIARIGSQYLLTLEANSCENGETLAAEKETVSGAAGLLSAMDSLTRRMRRELGESRREVAQFQVPLAQATTNSLDALRAYSQALEASDRGDTVAEEALFQRAIALDPNFASAYKGLSASYNSRQDFLQAAAEIQKAYDLRAHTTERERMAIEIAYNTYGTRDWEAAIVSLRLYNEIYPNDASSWFNLCRLYSQLGEHPQAVEAGEHGYQLAPHSGVGRENLVWAYRRASRFADAKRVAAAAIAEGKDRWGIHGSLLQIAFAEHDVASLKRETDWASAHPQIGQMLELVGFMAASQGKLREARADFTRARQEGLRNGDADFADDASLSLAGILLEYGDPQGALATIHQMSSMAIDEGTADYFLAELGDLAPAQKQIAKIAASNTRNTLNLYFDLPELRACVDQKQNKSQQAIADLEPARKYQLRDLGVPYQRARAEAEAGMLDQAVDDYRLLLANPGVEPIWPEFTLTHLRLARVLVQNKQAAQARVEYQAFLDEWKNGDPDLQLLIDAKREFAALKN